MSLSTVTSQNSAELIKTFKTKFISLLLCVYSVETSSFVSAAFCLLMWILDKTLDSFNVETNNLQLRGTHFLF